MLVTVLTVAFNAEATIAKTMESVLNQTYDILNISSSTAHQRTKL